MSSGREAYVALALRHRDEFLARLREAGACQKEVLRRVTTINAATKFGAEHRLDGVGDVRDLRRRVPIRDWDALRPWMDRTIAGEAGVLTAEPPAVFVTSSGTTGARKHVPWTRAYIEECFLPFFWAAIGNTVRNCPDAIARDDATLNMKWDPLHPVGATPGGVPAMGASQVDFARRFGHELASEPGTRAPWAAVPSDVADEHDRMYWRLRLAIESDLAAIIGINPGMIAALPEQLRAWQGRLLRELRDGTILGRPVRAPNARRADDLERLAACFGRLLPAHVWPNLRLVYCWTGGPAALYVPELRAEYGPNARFLPAPVAASEGPVGLPIDRHPTAGPLVVSSVLYEFVDADRRVEPDAPTLLFDELRAGAQYHVVMTHVGGMVRYALGDVVRVVDHVHGVPRVEYVGRSRSSSVAGEELRAAHLVDALRDVSVRRGLPCRNASWRVDRADAIPRYAVAAEIRGGLHDEEPAGFARDVDERLRAMHPKYGEARARGALGPIALHVVREGGFFEGWQRRVAKGVRPTQVKDAVFVDDEEEWRALV